MTIIFPLKRIYCIFFFKRVQIFDDQIVLKLFKKIFLKSTLQKFLLFLLPHFIIGLIKFFHHFLLCYAFLINDNPINGQPLHGSNLRCIIVAHR
jgi:hypothetical protein